MDLFWLKEEGVSYKNYLNYKRYKFDFFKSLIATELSEVRLYPFPNLTSDIYGSGFAELGI